MRGTTDLILSFNFPHLPFPFTRLDTVGSLRRISAEFCVSLQQFNKKEGGRQDSESCTEPVWRSGRTEGPGSGPVTSSSHCCRDGTQDITRSDHTGDLSSHTGDLFIQHEWLRWEEGQCQQNVKIQNLLTLWKVGNCYNLGISSLIDQRRVFSLSQMLIVLSSLHCQCSTLIKSAPTTNVAKT